MERNAVDADAVVAPMEHVDETRRNPIEIIVKETSPPHCNKFGSHSDSSDSEYECFEEAQTEWSEQRDKNVADPTDRHLSPQAFPDFPGVRYKGRHSYHSESAKPLVEADFVDSDPEIDSEVEMDSGFCFPSLDGAKEQAEHFVKRVWEVGWKATHFHVLPEWLQDNDFLHSGHRPPLPSFNACFRSIFRIHTETGNIWTHMLGCAAFVGVAAYFLTRSHVQIQFEDKIVFAIYFIGAIGCLGFSFAFHTVHCHSERVGKLFSKLDYCGITLLIMGSFIPWLFYGFYCRREPKIAYMALIVVLGVICIVVSLWEKFGQPQFRALRAGLFVGLGLSGVIPCIHYFITDGFWSAVYEASLGWILLMAAMYITGALLYACRIPERFFPGKCDIWFQSHQLFHLFVVAAAFVHYHGISTMAMYRLSSGSCTEQLLQPTFG